MLNELADYYQHQCGWINTTEPRELIFWMDLLHADADMIKEAVDAVGPSEDKVREHINRRRLH